MENSGEQSKRRLRNYAERNDCQLSRYGDNRSMTQKGGREGEQSKRRLRNYAEMDDCQLSRYGDYRSMTQKGGRGDVILMVPNLV